MNEFEEWTLRQMLIANVNKREIQFARLAWEEAVRLEREREKPVAYVRKPSADHFPTVKWLVPVEQVADLMNLYADRSRTAVPAKE